MANEKKGNKVLFPIGIIVLVVVVIGFVRWALVTNSRRNPIPQTDASTNNAKPATR